LARSLGLSSKRLQCTPDLMPGDVLGANIFDFRTQQFALTRGPVFTEFLLVDEINRSPPKTQSALLEAMQERSVSIDGTTHALPEAFMVAATQNPVESEGTYPLPEAQLDRFLFKIDVGYPSEALEVAAVLAHGATSAAPDLDVLGVSAVVQEHERPLLLRLAARTHADEKIAQYVVRLARETREHPALSVGLSPRAATHLLAASRAFAACDARAYVLPDDVKVLFPSVARHRVMLAPAAEMEGTRVDDVLREIARQATAPR
jgi:MoxR-like ATPase